MKIGIISDTHDHLTYTEEVVEYLLNHHISYLIHAGDIGQKVLDFLGTLPIKTVAVYGNTDSGLQNSTRNVILERQPYYFKIAKTTFKLMHQPYYLTPDSDIVIYGHLHRFECQRSRALFINPGEVCAREKPRIEAALLELPSLAVNYCSKELSSNSWQYEKRCHDANHQ